MPKKSDVTLNANEAFNQIPRSNPLEDDFNWTIPFENIPLPTGGKIYPQNSPLHNLEFVQIKAMTAQEEDILMSRALIKDGTVLTHLLNSCIVNKNINARDLSIGDRNALLVATRITGYGSAYKVEVTCPECSAKQNHTFDLAELGIKRLKITPIAPGLNQFEFTLPVSKKRVVFKFLNGKDEEEQALTADRRRRLMPDVPVENLVTARLEACIVSIEGVTDRNKINTFIRSMPALDSRTLRNYISDNEPGMDMTGEFTCAQCRADTRVSLPLGSSFFWP